MLSGTHSRLDQRLRPIIELSHGLDAQEVTVVLLILVMRPRKFGLEREDERFRRSERVDDVSADEEELERAESAKSRRVLELYEEEGN